MVKDVPLKPQTATNTTTRRGQSCTSFGHAAGLEDLYLLECGLLGCGYGDYIMDRAEKPTAIPNEDRDYLRDVYYNHTPHPASSGQ